MCKRICQYRNCKKDISNMRSNAKFCSRNCKSCERKYKSNYKKKIERDEKLL